MIGKIGIFIVTFVGISDNKELPMFNPYMPRSQAGTVTYTSNQIRRIHSP
jgi:hypothetical protein